MSDCYVTQNDGNSIWTKKKVGADLEAQDLAGLDLNAIDDLLEEEIVDFDEEKGFLNAF